MLCSVMTSVETKMFDIFVSMFQHLFVDVLGFKQPISFGIYLILVISQI